jgi:hypothetical protein
LLKQTIPGGRVGFIRDKKLKFRRTGGWRLNLIVVECSLAKTHHVF